MAVFADGRAVAGSGGDRHQGPAVSGRMVRRGGHGGDGGPVAGDGARRPPRHRNRTRSTNRQRRWPAGSTTTAATTCAANWTLITAGSSTPRRPRPGTPCSTPGQVNVSWADALVEIAHRSLDGAPAQRRERFRVNWFIDPTDPIPARFTDGLAVPDWLRDQLLCDGTVSPVFTDGALPVSVGRTQHQVPDRTRRLVLAAGPQVPGPVVHPDPLAAGPPHHPRPPPRPHRHLEPDRPVPRRPPPAPSRPARHHRQRRPARRARPSPTPTAGSSTPPPDPSNPPDPHPQSGQTLRTPPRRTTPTLGHPVPRPTPPTTRAKRRSRLRAHSGQPAPSSGAASRRGASARSS